ncbi:MAG: lipoate protein ligase C-terminal domain-containing protein [archaeon]
MKGEATEKVSGGKLLVIKTEYDSKIHHVQILGDFFAHPEESIEEIEAMLCGIDVSFDENKVKKLLDSLLVEKNYELIGLDVESIVRVLKKSIEAKE